MATLANTGMANQAAFGQHGSALVDDGSAYTPPSGKVVVSITCLSDTNFTVLTQEDPAQFFGTTTPFGEGTNQVAVAVSNTFPQGVTIYGRWTAVTASSSTGGGYICYLGPAA